MRLRFHVSQETDGRIAVAVTADTPEGAIVQTIGLSAPINDEGRRVVHPGRQAPLEDMSVDDAIRDAFEAVADLERLKRLKFYREGKQI